MTPCYLSRAKAFCGWEFASCRTDVEALTRIWARVRFEVSTAKSASRMALSAAVVFSRATCSELTVVLSVSF